MLEIDLDTFKYKSPRDFQDLFFFRMYVVGSSGSGKTYSVNEFTKTIAPFLDKIYVINPTLDRKLRESGSMVNQYKEYSECNDACLITIINEIKEDINEFKRYLRYKDIYKRFIKLDIPEDIHVPSYLESVGFERKEVRLLEKYDFISPKIAFKDFDYTSRPPNSLIIIDDAMGSSIYREGKSPLVNFLVKSRHYKTNIILLSQFFKAVPKRLRSNMTHYVVFKTFDKSQLNSIYEEINSYLSYDNFIKMFEENTREKHSFIMIDLKNQKITSGFNKVLFRFHENIEEPNSE
jgi:hypothetical protein